MKLIIKLCLLLVTLFPLPSLAELPQQIKDDFAPISGVIVMPVGDQFLIDLDATSGLKEGDILSLTTPGEKIIHPETKEILGTLEQVRGYIRVSQVKSGYSYAKVITSQVPPEKGAQVKRFEQVPVSFSSTADTRVLEAELKNGLPHLKWLEPGSGEVAQLTFTLNGSNLQIKNTEGVVVKSYRYDAGQLSALPSPSMIQNTFRAGEPPKQSKSTLNRAVDNLLGAVGIGKQDERLENPGIIRSREQSGTIWMGPNLEGNPVGLAVADYDNDGRAETAVAMEDHIQILRIVEGQLNLVTTIELKGGLHALSLDSIDLDNNGTPELYVSANNGTRVRSFVIEYRNDRYQTISDGLPWLLRVIDLPQQGKILIGQLVDSTETPFTAPAVRLIRQQDEITKAETIASPGGSFFSFTRLAGADGDIYAYISAGDYLNVATGQLSRLWESSDNFGGSEEFFYNRAEKDIESVQPIYIQKRLLRLPSGEILAAQNEGPGSCVAIATLPKAELLPLNGTALLSTNCGGHQHKKAIWLTSASLTQIMTARKNWSWSLNTAAKTCCRRAAQPLLSMS